MPVISAYLNGSTAGTPPGKNDHPRAKRGEIKGWSPHAVRRHTKWLYSIDDEQLSASARGWAVTLTMKTCPPDAQTFVRLRNQWLERMRKHGCDLTHWVVEWQRRRVPHLHCALYELLPVVHTSEVSDDPRHVPEDAPEGPSSVPSGATAEPKPDVAAVGPLAGMQGTTLGVLAVIEWLDVFREYGASLGAQDVKEIDGSGGWGKYLSKHASRGVAHYQRQGMPVGWERTGRLWGKGGDWPEIPPLRFQMSSEAYWRYRRQVRSWRVANARQAVLDARGATAARTARRRLVAARRALACGDPKLSAVRGVSEWTAQGVILDIVGMLVDEGHLILQEDAA